MTERPEAREGANIWDRLRRRKVVQWGFAYAAGAWGLAQGVAYMRDTFGWPHQLQQAVTVLLLLGLPVVLVLAWYHGDRGEQRVTRTELAVLTLLFLLGGGLFWYYQRTILSPESLTAAPSSAAAVAVVGDRSIAVLPFMNMSSDSEQEYFSDGISEELLNLLTKVPELKVIARTSSFAFKGKDVDIAEIAKRLHVAYVLEGSVRKSGNKVRVTAQLVRAADSTHLWSDAYDRALDDVFAIQDEIAGAVVAQLKIKLLGAAPTAKPVDPRVYATLLQARALVNRGSAESLAKAIEKYRQALAVAPNEPRAWSGLGEAYLYQVSFVQRPAADGRRLARDALEKALALDPDDALAHTVLAAVLSGDDPAAAASHLERALALDPSNVEVLRYVSAHLFSLGRIDQAIAFDAFAVNRDPANPLAHNELGVTYYYARHWDEALASLRTALALSPDLIGAHYTIGQILLLRRDARAALVEMQAEPDEPGRLQGLALAQHALGQKAKSDAALNEVIARHDARDQAAWIAVVYAWRGEPDHAFDWLDRAVADRQAIGWIVVEPMLASLHDDPRWLPLLRKIGRAPEQLAAVNFDVKLPQ